MDKTAIFGGTFNPFHNGHLEIVNSLLKFDDVNRVVVIPTAIPPHKEAPFLASGEDRFAMCRLAVAGLDAVSVSDIELERGGRSYTYDTVISLKEELKCDICITCGADMIATLPTWYRYNDLISEAEIIAFRRAGIDDSTFDNAVRKIKNDGGVVRVVDIDITDVSSTQIRNGEKLAIPDAVMKYIKENKLYGE